MFQNPADEKQRGIGKPGVAVPSKEWFIAFPKRDVGVHAAAVIGKERLGHESNGFVVSLGHVADDVFVVLHVVGHFFQWRETNVDLRLAGGGDFVMLPLNRHARFFQLKTHFVANIL